MWSKVLFHSLFSIDGQVIGCNMLVLVHSNAGNQRKINFYTEYLILDSFNLPGFNFLKEKL